MNYFLSKLGFSGIYTLLFGMVSAIAAVIIVHDASGDGWEFLWIYTGSAAMITAFFFSKYFIERKNKFNSWRLIVIGTIVGILSHWLSWYETIIVNYIKLKFFGMSFLGTPKNPINGIYGALKMSFISLLFFGWTAIPISVVLLMFSKRLINSHK